MNADLKARWVAALRSGTYKQGTGALRITREGKEDEYCCLGVLCDVVDPDPKHWDHFPFLYEAPDTYYMRYKGSEGVPPTSVTELYDKGFNAEDITETLVDLNDKEEASFEDIAQWIENNL